MKKAIRIAVRGVSKEPTVPVLRLGSIALALFAAGSGLSGCDGPESAESVRPAADDVQPSQGRDASVSIPSRARTITANLSLVVDDVEAAMDGVRRTVGNHGGYVEEAEISGGSSRYATLSACVPAGRLEAFHDEVETVGVVVSANERVRDVTDQLTDTAARVRNAAAHESRLIELLSDRTGSLDDVLAVENELSRVRETIERMEAAQLTLQREVQHARIRIELRPQEVPFWESPNATVLAAGTRGIEVAAAVSVGLVAAVLTVGPTAVLALVGLLACFFLLRAMVRLHRRRTYV